MEGDRLDDLIYRLVASADLIPTRVRRPRRGVSTELVELDLYGPLRSGRGAHKVQ
jgi:hypothetical protein